MENDGVTASAALLVLTAYLAKTGDAKLLALHLRENAKVFAQDPGTAEAAKLLEAMAKQAGDY